MADLRLTLPSYEPGATHIIVDGKKVGFALGRYDDWQAFLWPIANRHLDRHPGRTLDDDRVVTRPTLRDLRTELRRRLAEQGPWWTEEDTTDAEA